MTVIRTPLAWLAVAIALAAPARSLQPFAWSSAERRLTVQGFTLTNRNGMEVRTIAYGAIIVSIKVPDRTGRFDDVVIGHDNLDGYLNHSRWFGAVVGRYGNRIAKGRFTLDGREYTLATNNGPNHLHGGNVGFDKVIWDVISTDENSLGPSVTYRHISPDGDEGYPGRLEAQVKYWLTNENELRLEYDVITDKATPVNLTNHTYFNLAGDGSGDVLNHVLTINASQFTPVDATKIPTGKIAPVAGTPFDFRKPTRVGARIDADDPQIRIGGGYDHNFVLNRSGPGLQWAARVSEPSTGRTLEVLTTEPGLQLNSANALDGSVTGKSGHIYKARTGLCLETQYFPDSPNQPSFPSTIVRPGATFRATTVWRFGVTK